MGPLEWKGWILLLAGLIAGGCILAGSLLYIRTKKEREERGTVELSAQGFSAVIKDYGPGVALVALGVFLLLFVVTRSFSEHSRTEITRYDAVTGEITETVVLDSQVEAATLLTDEERANLANSRATAAQPAPLEPARSPD